MPITVIKTTLKEILYLRALFLQENNVQIRYNACHERGWSDNYIITYHGNVIGYGSIKGNEHINDRDTVFEFYIIPPFRNLASTAFVAFLHSSNVSLIECQSNDLLLTSLLYEYGCNLNSNVILFEEGFTSNLKADETQFRKRNESDTTFEHKAEPAGEYVLELNNEIVATGGFLLHYNFPFADLYMEVKDDHRTKGFGSFLIQEIKTQCYLAGRVPAARTSMDNIASRATLMKAGLKIAGYMLLGEIKVVR